MAHEPIELQIGKLLTERELTIAAAESCTGGLILHRLTNIPGSSVYVLGGFVVYSNEAKIKYAQVKTETLQRYGAVSAETAEEMAFGTRRAFASSLALSVTGIAGPGGGTETKPVGLTYIGLSTPDGVQIVRHVWAGDRESNKAQSAQEALQLLYDWLTRA